MFEKIKEEIIGRITFDVVPPVNPFTGRCEELEILYNHLQRKKTTVISGLGGIGKSELARKFADKYKEKYMHVLWINAKTNKTIEKAFKKLASEVGIPTIDCDGKEKKEKKIISIIEEIYKFFEKKRHESLFIFDDAETCNTQEDENTGIEKYLFDPRDTDTKRHDTKRHVLITSRNQEWDNYNMEKVLLGTFTVDESKDFITTTLDKSSEEVPRRDDLFQDEIKNLSETLQHFPLALQQALVYIKVKNDEIKDIKKGKFDISDYLEQYKLKSKDLLDFPFPNDSDNRYIMTTFKTWKVTLETIKSKINGQKALEILYIMAYFANNNIPVKVWTGELMESCVLLLKQYSMISLEQDEANIHKLVQQVTRLELQEQGKQEEVFKKVFNLLIDNGKEAKEVKQKLLPHLKAFLSHMDDWRDELNKKIGVKQKIEKGLLTIMGDAYYDGGEYTETRKLLERALTIQEDNYGVDHSQVTSTSEHHSNANGSVTKLFEKALVIVEQYYRLDYLVDQLVDLGKASGALGDHQKAKTFLELALVIGEKHYGPNHFKVASILVNLSNAYGVLLGDEKEKFKVVSILVNRSNSYGVLGDKEKIKELLKRALKIVEIYNSCDHFNIVNSDNEEKELLERALAIVEKYYSRDHLIASIIRKK